MRNKPWGKWLLQLFFAVWPTSLGSINKILRGIKKITALLCRWIRKATNLYKTQQGRLGSISWYLGSQWGRPRCLGWLEWLRAGIDRPQDLLHCGFLTHMPGSLARMTQRLGLAETVNKRTCMWLGPLTAWRLVSERETSRWASVQKNEAKAIWLLALLPLFLHGWDNCKSIHIQGMWMETPPFNGRSIKNIGGHVSKLPHWSELSFYIYSLVDL